MNPAAILDDLRGRGLTVRADRGRVILAPGGRVTPLVRMLVQRHEPAILAALVQEGTPSAPAPPGAPAAADLPPGRQAPAPDAAPPGPPPSPARMPVSQSSVERRLSAKGEGLHRLRDEPGWRTYRFSDNRTTGLYLTLEGLCECRGWLPPSRDDEPFQAPAPSEQHAAQRLRRALLPRGLGARPYWAPSSSGRVPAPLSPSLTTLPKGAMCEPAHWLSYDINTGAPVYHAESLEALAAHYGVTLEAEGDPS